MRPVASHAALAMALPCSACGGGDHDGGDHRDGGVPDGGVPDGGSGEDDGGEPGPDGGADAGPTCTPREELPAPVTSQVQLAGTCGGDTTCGGELPEGPLRVETLCLDARAL